MARMLSGRRIETRETRDSSNYERNEISLPRTTKKHAEIQKSGRLKENFEYVTR